MTPELARLLRTAGVNRVSLGAQSFEPRLLDVLERRASPEDVRRAFYHCVTPVSTTSRSISSTGSPARALPSSRATSSRRLALGPEHLSCYELEAKPGTRFTLAHGEAARAAGGGDGGLFRARRRDARRRRLPLVRDRELLPARPVAPATTSRTGAGEDYLGIGIGAVSTVAGRRWRNRPRLARLLARRSRPGEAAAWHRAARRTTRSRGSG